MSTPINTNQPITNVSQPTGATTTTQSGATPNLDVFETSLASILLPPAADAGKPQLSLASYYTAISSANLLEQAQKLLAEITDPQFRSNMMAYAAQEAQIMSQVITLVYQYKNLSDNLGKLSLTADAATLNAALAAYKNSTNATANNAAIDTLNTAIGAYNTSQGQYDTALQAYQSSLSSFQGAQGSYDSALQTWNSALSAFQAGTINQAQLNAAKATFTAASNQFNNVDTPAFAASQTQFNTAQGNMTTAQTKLNAASAAYNTYATHANADLATVNAAIQKWNTDVGGSAGILNQLNSIGAELGVPSVASSGVIPPVVGMSPFTPPSGDALTASVQADIDKSNTTSGSLNTLIGDISTQVAAINASGYTPPLTAPATLGTIANLPATASDDTAVDVPPFVFPTTASVNPPDPPDLVTIYLDPLLSALQTVMLNNTAEGTYGKSPIVPLPAPLTPQGLNIISAGLGASPLQVANTSSTNSVATSPFLAKILSTQAFEAFFDIYGATPSSDLVNQFGSLHNRLQTTAGLTSAGPASSILSNAAINSGSSGDAAINTAVALGNVAVVHELAGGKSILQAVENIISNDPTLANLTPDQKNGLISAIAGELGASLTKESLNTLASALQLPGLVTQILAQQAGNPSAFNGELLQNVLFANQLAATFQISENAADGIVQAAIAQVNANNQAESDESATTTASSSPQPAPFSTTEDDTATQIALQAAVSSQLIKDGVNDANIQDKVQEAANVANNQLQALLNQASVDKNDAFQQSILKSLNAAEFDPVQAAVIASQSSFGSIEDVNSSLKNKGLTDEEAKTITTAASTAASQKDPVTNPLSSFLVQKFGTTTESAGLLKAQIVNILSPAVGMRNSLNVAENYGNLIYSSANSVTGLLQTNENRLQAISHFVYNERIVANYRDGGS